MCFIREIGACCCWHLHLAASDWFQLLHLTSLLSLNGRRGAGAAGLPVTPEGIRRALLSSWLQGGSPLGFRMGAPWSHEQRGRTNEACKRRLRDLPQAPFVSRGKPSVWQLPAAAAALPRACRARGGARRGRGGPVPASLPPPGIMQAARREEAHCEALSSAAWPPASSLAFLAHSWGLSKLPTGGSGGTAEECGLPRQLTAARAVQPGDSRHHGGGGAAQRPPPAAAPHGQRGLGRLGAALRRPVGCPRPVGPGRGARLSRGEADGAAGGRGGCPGWQEARLGTALPAACVDVGSRAARAVLGSSWFS